MKPSIITFSAILEMDILGVLLVCSLTAMQASHSHMGHIGSACRLQCIDRSVANAECSVSIPS